MDIGIKSRFHLHPHLLLAAFPLSPFQCLDLAQNERCRLPDFWGAFSFDPVALLYFLRPFAVRPPPLETDSFSPLPTERLTLATSSLSLDLKIIAFYRFFLGQTSTYAHPSFGSACSVGRVVSFSHS